MSLLSRYILRNFGHTFFPVFAALYLIMSVAFFIQISVQTSYLKVTFGEILQLYLFYVPELLLYTLPVSYFAAGVISLSKLSFDLELIVLFALQGSIKNLMRPLAVVAGLMMAVLLITGLWLKPKAMLMSKEMIYKKEDTSQLNLKPSEYGQKFGNWLLHVEKKFDDRHYGNLIMFSKQKDNAILIKAKSGALLQSQGYFNLVLEDGETYSIGKDGIKEIRYQEMRVNEKSSMTKLNFSNIIEFWREWMQKRNPRDFTAAILTAFFPILSLLLIVSVGVVNPRHQKNRSSLFVMIFITFYYALT
jgi:lipopolysaccharide export system permease protein